MGPHGDPMGPMGPHGAPWDPMGPMGTHGARARAPNHSGDTVREKRLLFHKILTNIHKYYKKHVKSERNTRNNNNKLASGPDPGPNVPRDKISRKEEPLTLIYTWMIWELIKYLLDSGDLLRIC